MKVIFFDGPIGEIVLLHEAMGRRPLANASEAYGILPSAYSWGYASTDAARSAFKLKPLSRIEKKLLSTLYRAHPNKVERYALCQAIGLKIDVTLNIDETYKLQKVIRGLTARLINTPFHELLTIDLVEELTYYGLPVSVYDALDFDQIF